MNFKNMTYQQLLYVMHNNYYMVGSGRSRWCFDIGNGLVLKLAKNRSGIIQNLEEMRVYGVTQINLAKLHKDLSNRYFVIMDRIEPDGSRGMDSYFYGSKLHTTLKDNNINLHDIHGGNYAIVNNEMIVYDYGYTSISSNFMRNTLVHYDNVVVNLFGRIKGMKVKRVLNIDTAKNTYWKFTNRWVPISKKDFEELKSGEPTSITNNRKVHFIYD